MNGLIMIFIGGGLGSVVRYLSILRIGKLTGETFPYGTLAVNIAGSLLAGFLIQVFTNKLQITEDLRGFLFAGFLGGFTTFSAFSLDTYRLIDVTDSFPTAAVVYVLASVVLSVGACLLGVYAAKGWVG